MTAHLRRVEGGTAEVSVPSVDFGTDICRPGSCGSKSVCLSVCLSVCPLVCLSVYLQQVGIKGPKFSADAFLGGLFLTTERG